MSQILTQKSLFGIYIGLVLIFGLLFNIRNEIVLTFQDEKFDALKVNKFHAIHSKLVHVLSETEKADWIARIWTSENAESQVWRYIPWCRTIQLMARSSSNM